MLGRMELILLQKHYMKNANKALELCSRHSMDKKMIELIDLINLSGVSLSNFKIHCGKRGE